MKGSPKLPVAPLLLAMGLLFSHPRSAEANIVSGLSKIIAGAFQLPLSVLVGTFSGPPVVGTLMGVVNGTIRTVTLVAGGTLEVAADGVALAKRAAPYVLPFLL